VHESGGEDIGRIRAPTMEPRSRCLSMPLTSGYSHQELPRISVYKTSTSYESIPNLEQTRVNNTVWYWAGTGLVRGMTNEHGECTQTSVHITSGFMLTDSMKVTHVESNTAEYADRRKEWKYDDTLPHNLLVPHPDDWGVVPVSQEGKKSYFQKLS
jgi:hypothetical protein